MNKSMIGSKGRKEGRYEYGRAMDVLVTFLHKLHHATLHNSFVDRFLFLKQTDC